MAARHNIMKRPVLGAPVKLGMLYDAHTSEFIYGHSLWDETFIVQRRAVELTPYSNFSVSSGDNKLEMVKTLEIKADLRVKIMCGLMDVEGAAEYLKQEKESHKEAHVSLTYHCKSGTESLTMEHLALDNVKYKELLSDGATHVVTAVEYGGMMVFDFKKSEASIEDKEKAEAQLRLALNCSGVEKFGAGESHMNNELSFASQGKPSKSSHRNRTVCASSDSPSKAARKNDVSFLLKLLLELEKRARKLSLQGFQCKCYGDVQLKKLPLTLSEAMDLLADVPAIFQRDQRAVVNGRQLFGVPVMVRLLPLHAIDPKASLPFARSIGVNHFEDCQEVLQSLTNAELGLEKLQENDVCKLADEPKKEIKDALAVIKDYRNAFLKRLNGLLTPQVSTEENNIEELCQLIDAFKRSPFAEEHLHALAETKSEEFRTLSECVNRLRDAIPKLTVAFRRNERVKLLSADDSRPLVVFSLGALLTEPHKHLQAMKDFLKSSTTHDTYQLESGWLHSEEANKLPGAVSRFIRFAKYEGASTRFALVHYPIVSEKTSGLTLTFDTDGQDRVFQLPEVASGSVKVVKEQDMKVIGKPTYSWFGANSNVKVLNKTSAHMKHIDTELNHGCVGEHPKDIPPRTILQYGIYTKGGGCDHTEIWSVGDTHMVSIWKKVLGHIYVGQSNTVKLRVWLQTSKDDSKSVKEKQDSGGGTTFSITHGEYKFNVTIGSGEKATHVLEILETDTN